MKIILLIGTGGFVGSILRYLVSRFMQAVFETTFPIGTFTVNILGSFLIGIIYALSEKSNILSAEFRVFLTVGLCGGFTTFSSFAYENFSMINVQQLFYTALYMGLSLFLGLIAVYLGVLLGKVL